MVRAFAVAGLSVVFAAPAARPDDASNSGRPKSVYSFDPWVDGSLIVGGAVAVALPYAFASRLITPRCPCDPREVNPFDRHVIGNSSPFLDSASDVTAGPR